MSQKTKRLAVVIGNSDYVNLTEIPNAINDAKAVQEELVTLGFEVTLGINQERRQILECISSIRDSWQREASEIVVYYSGHGTSINGKVFLGPVDATSTLDFIDQNFLCVDIILEYLLTYRNDDNCPIIIILDCCRSAFETDDARQGDPLRGVRESTSQKKSNIAILYSTAEGIAASDGDNDSGHSPYTEILLKNMVQDRTIEEMQYELIKFFDSSDKFHSKQMPWIYQCLYKPYRFNLIKPTATSSESSISPPSANDLIKKRFYGVPRKNNDFINRPKILAKIEATLGKNNEVNILALRGLGGMGKTQLMLHYCYLHRTEYELIFWLEVDGLAATLDSFLKLAINLGLDEKSAKEEYENEKIIEWVCDWLEKKEGWLLLLNNIDDTMAAKLFGVLPRIGGDIILTTREYISPKKAKIITVDKMDEEEALSLLLSTAEMDSIDHESARYSNAKTIVTELGFMALAVDLARAYVESMSTSFKDYLNVLKNHRDMLFSLRDEDNSHQYNHSLKTVWQLSFDRIRTQSPLAVELLEICAFLQPESIPVLLFKRQRSVLAFPLDSPSSSTSPETDRKALKAIQEAVAILVKFSFVTRTLNEDIDETEDPASDTLTIHRLLQKVIYDEMSNGQKIRWTCNIASAFNKEINFSDSYSTLTRTTMNAYLPHIRHFADMTNINRKEFMSDNLFELIIHTILYLLDNGVYYGVEELANFTLSISESIHEPESHFMGRSLHCLAMVYQSQGHYAKAEPLYERALMISEKVLGPEHPETAQCLDSLAELYMYQENMAKAEPLIERALMIKEKTLGSEHVKTAVSLNELAIIYVRKEIYSKAEPLHERALAIREKAFGPDHPEILDYLNNLALLYFRQGNYEKAEQLSERAVMISEKAFGSEHPSAAKYMSNLAIIYSKQESYAKAKLLLERALMITEKTLGPEHPGMASILMGFGQVLEHQGNFFKAERLYKRAIAINEKVFGPEHLETAASLHDLALLYYKLDHYTDAKPLFERALMIVEKTLSPEHPKATGYRANLNMNQSKLGKVDL